MCIIFGRHSGEAISTGSDFLLLQAHAFTKINVQYEGASSIASHTSFQILFPQQNSYFPSKRTIIPAIMQFSLKLLLPRRPAPRKSTSKIHWSKLQDSASCTSIPFSLRKAAHHIFAHVLGPRSGTKHVRRQFRNELPLNASPRLSNMS